MSKRLDDGISSIWTRPIAQSEARRESDRAPEFDPQRPASSGARVAEALAAGVSVLACENTLRHQQLVQGDMLPGIG